MSATPTSLSQGVQVPTTFYKPLTFAHLPAAHSGYPGCLSLISDSPTPTPGQTVTVGGGSNSVFVWWNGTNWIVVGGASGEFPIDMSYLQLEALTYGTLPASPTEGAIASISDANTAAVGATVASGGGSNKVILQYNGTAWVVLGGSTQYEGQAGAVTTPAGAIGQVVGGAVVGTGSTATVTITIAAPGVVTWAGHGFSTTIPQPVVFTTTGALPTGLTAGTVYYTVPSSVTTNTFEVATSVANAIAGTAITTTGTQSGTQTGTAGAALATGTPLNVTGLALPAGDWDVWGQLVWNAGATTTVTVLKGSISQTSATLNGPGTVVGGSEADILETSQTATNGLPTLQVPQCQISVAATTNIFLVADATFATSTLGAYGFLFARRRS